MEILLNELLKGKATRIKNKDYFETEAYVTPFLDRVSSLTDNFVVKVETPNQITYTKEGDVDFEDITFNRVWIQGVLPEEYCIDNHDEVIGMVYGLDCRKPIAKFYRGGLNRACTNLCVFNPTFLSVQEMEAEIAIDYRPLDNLINKSSELKNWLTTLNSRVVNCSDVEVLTELGKWVDRCIESTFNSGIGTPVKLATSVAIDAYKLLFKKDDSPYYVTEDTTSMFNIYNAFTDVIRKQTDKDIMNPVEKCLLLRKILDI